MCHARGRNTIMATRWHYKSTRDNTRNDDDEMKTHFCGSNVRQAGKVDILSRYTKFPWTMDMKISAFSFPLHLWDSYASAVLVSVTGFGGLSRKHSNSGAVVPKLLQASSWLVEWPNNRYIDLHLVNEFCVWNCQNISGFTFKGVFWDELWL